MSVTALHMGIIVSGLERLIQFLETIQSQRADSEKIVARIPFGGITSYWFSIYTLAL